MACTLAVCPQPQIPIPRSHHQCGSLWAERVGGSPMTALNKQALREAAEKATPGRIGDRIDGSGSIKYECHGYDGSLVLRADHKDMEYGFIGDNGNADELFFRLCVPDAILALLDDLEAAEKRIAELEAREVAVKQFDDFQIVHYGATEDYAKGYIDCQNNYNKALTAAGIGVKGE
ncbi:ead/Ea22-like family protein [Salmonella enterica subsp. enterica serovar Kimberley]|nr:ead/Ea22-like family protein [Salmonella enterica subsp. enterica serovar Kimberley]